MKMKHLTPLFTLLLCQALAAQVKIGDNPENIHPASLLELESTQQVLVITRVTTAQMQAITPSNGAMVYNTDETCLFYYDGQRWINLCEALGLSFTNDPIVNRDSTIIITEFDDRINFEVGRIRGGDDTGEFNNIIDFSVTSRDIQNNSINIDKLADASVGTAELFDNAVTAAKINSNVAGTGLTQNADGALEVDLSDLTGNGTILSEDLTVGGTENPLFGDVTLEITPGAVGNEEISGDAITSDKIADQAVSTEDIQDDAVTASKIGEDVAGIGLVQAGDGSLDVAIGEITGDGALSSPNGTITLVGITESALFEDVEMDVTIPQLIDIDAGNSIITGTNGGLFSTDDQNAGEVPFDDINAGLGVANVQEAIDELAASNAADLDTDPTNEFSLTGAGLPGTPGISEGQTYVDTTNGQLFAWDGTAWIPVGGTNAVDNDPDPLNEINTNFELNGTTLELTDNGGLLPLDLDPTFATDDELEALNVEDDDADPTNEQNISLELNGTSIELTDSGGMLPLDLDITFATDAELAAISVEDDDADPTNEQNISLELNGTSIELTDSGGMLPLDLDPVFVTNDELAASITNLENTNLVQSEPDRTYDLNNGNLRIIGEGSMRIGSGTGTINNKLRVDGTIRAEGIRNTFGTLPTSVAYSFNDDSNTGMYRADPDVLGLVTDGVEALRIDENQNIGIGSDVGVSFFPSSKFHLNGSFAAPITSSSINITLDDSHHTVILDVIGTVVFLPAPGDVPGRIYILKNTSGGIVTTNPAFNDSIGNLQTEISAVVWIQSSGTSWEQIN